MHIEQVDFGLHVANTSDQISLLTVPVVSKHMYVRKYRVLRILIHQAIRHRKTFSTCMVSWCTFATPELERNEVTHTVAFVGPCGGNIEENSICDLGT
jgi:hypothetical protein